MDSNILYKDNSSNIKIKICSIEKFRQFIIDNSDFNEWSRNGIFVEQKLTESNINNFLTQLSTIEVSKFITAKELADLLWEDNVLFTAEENRFVKGDILERTIRSLFCYQVSNDSLKCNDTLDTLGFEDSVLVVTNEDHFNLRGRIYPQIEIAKSSTTFLDYIQTDIHNTYSRRWKYLGIMLYTDEDNELSQYVRLHYSLLHKMTGDLLCLNIIEQPHLLKGVSAKNYWKSKLSSQVYTTLNFIGYTNYKPYNSADIYDIVKKFGISTAEMPCIMIFSNFEKDEKIIIKISGDLVGFFRALVACIEAVDREIINLKENGKVSIEGTFMKFSYFQKRFTELWSETFLKNEANKKSTYQYDFKGNTVFVNNPSGTIIFKDFLNKKKQ
jgi:hypothetical protein